MRALTFVRVTAPSGQSRTSTRCANCSHSRYLSAGLSQAKRNGVATNIAMTLAKGRGLDAESLPFYSVR